MTRIPAVAMISLSLISVAACGETTSDRALSGAGIGAGVDAMGGLLVGAPVEGAVIGAVIGGGTGAITSPEQINLGRPIWRDRN